MTLAGAIVHDMFSYIGAEEMSNTDRKIPEEKEQMDKEFADKLLAVAEMTFSLLEEIVRASNTLPRLSRPSDVRSDNNCASIPLNAVCRVTISVRRSLNRST